MSWEVMRMIKDQSGREVFFKLFNQIIHPFHDESASYQFKNCGAFSLSACGAPLFNLINFSPPPLLMELYDRQWIASNEVPGGLCSNCQWHVPCLLGVKLLLCPLEICPLEAERWMMCRSLAVHVHIYFQFHIASIHCHCLRCNPSSVKSLLWLKKC